MKLQLERAAEGERRMSAIQRAYKTELDLNNPRTIACRKRAGAARWAYNWGLTRKQEHCRTTGKTPSAIDLHRELNALKQAAVPWMYEVSKCAPQEALRDLDSAFAHFFRRAQLKRQGKPRGKVGYPIFKSRTHGLGGLRLTGSLVVFPNAIQLPRLGRLRLKEHDYSPTNTHVLPATVSELAGRWYVAVLVEQEQGVLANSGSIVGVDLGINVLATLSDGTTELNPRHLQRRRRKLNRCYRAVSRKQRGSRNRKRAVQQLAILRRKVANQRANTLRQRASRLAKTKSVAMIEDLNVSGPLKNHQLARGVSDEDFREFRRQLTYKSTRYGCQVNIASRWEPTSKSRSGCGAVKTARSLDERVYRCDQCGLVIDRHVNAAINLEKLAGSSSDSQNACGEESAGQGHVALARLSSMKQEPNAI
jgi:putative transposase